MAYWRSIPDTVPIHFGAWGLPNSWGPKPWVLLLPLVAVGFYFGLGTLAKRPQSFNYPFAITDENRPRQYALASLLVQALRAEALWVFAYMEWGMVQTALGRATGLGGWFLAAALAAVFGTIAVYLVAAARARYQASASLGPARSLQGRNQPCGSSRPGKTGGASQRERQPRRVIPTLEARRI